MPQFGTSIEEYDEGRVLGSGGFAVVCRARCRNTGREVAIKKISKEKIRSGGLMNRVLQEVDIHSKLNHPGILKLFVSFEDQHYVYLILELCPNGELQKYLKSLKRVLYEAEAREYLSQILSAMMYLHSLKIMHRDLTLSNLLLDSQGRIKIADFGLATELKGSNPHTTMCGTPNFMSPEVVTRSSHGLASDVWSLGCMLYIMLVGHPPFNGKDAKASMTKAVMRDYKEIPSNVSANASSLISMCLQKKPDERIKLEAIPKHPFMTTGMKAGISGMSDSGMYTMSTVTSTNHTRMPLSAISESNGSRPEDPASNKHYPKYLNEGYRTCPSSPPVKMKSSPRHLLPTNAGVIDSNKREFNILPSRVGVFSGPPPIRRERDVSEERRKAHHSNHLREGSVSSNDRSDSSQHFLSNMSDDSQKFQRRFLVRGSSEQNLRQNVHMERDHLAHRRQRSLDRNTNHIDEMSRSAEYGQRFHQPREIYATTDDHQYSNRPTDDGNYNVDTPRGREQGISYGNELKVRSRENSCHRDREDYEGSHHRSGSEERSRGSNHSGFGENTHSNCRDTSKGRQRDYSHERYRDPSLDVYGGNTLERHRGRSQEPEHRTCREERGNNYNANIYSCCQSSQHRSSCNTRKFHESKEKDSYHSVGHSQKAGEKQPFAKETSEPYSFPKHGGNNWPRESSGLQRTGHSDRILGSIPPVKMQGSRVRETSTASYKSQGRSSKKMTFKPGQKLQEKVSPISSTRLEARRKQEKGVIMNILDDGEICMEFLSSKHGREKVVEVFRISSDGMRIAIHHPNKRSGCQPGDSPPPLPEEGADHIFSYESLPQKYWLKYLRASRFVDIVKANTPKVTYKCKEFQVKGTLMENSDFEAFFDCGLKMTIRDNNFVVKEKNGRVTTVPKSSVPGSLPEKFHTYYSQIAEIRDDCLESERFYTNLMERKGRNFFPVRMNPTCPGLSTPPTTARGNSHQTEDKENVPLALQSFQSTGRQADRLHGSLQKYTASIQSVTSYSNAPKLPLATLSPSNVEVETPMNIQNPTLRVNIPDIGSATKGDNGILVKFFDGTRLMVSSDANVPEVIFKDNNKGPMTYSIQNKYMPDVLKQKLHQIPVVMRYLDPHPPISSAASHHAAIR